MTEPQQFQKTITAMRYDGTPQGATPIIDWVLTNGGTATWSEPYEAAEYVQPDGTVEGHPAWSGGIAVRSVTGTYYHASEGEWVVLEGGDFYVLSADAFGAESFQSLA